MLDPPQSLLIKTMAKWGETKLRPSPCPITSEQGQVTAPQISASHRLTFNLEGEKPISQGCYTCGRVYCEVSAVVLLSHAPFHSLTLSCLGSWTLADVVNRSFHRETITADQTKQPNFWLCSFKSQDPSVNNSSGRTQFGSGGPPYTLSGHLKGNVRVMGQ